MMLGVFEVGLFFLEIIVHFAEGFVNLLLMIRGFIHSF